MSGLNSGAINDFEVNSSAISASGNIQADSFSSSSTPSINLAAGWSAVVAPIESSYTAIQVGVSGPTSMSLFGDPFTSSSFPSFTVNASGPDLIIGIDPWTSSVSAYVFTGEYDPTIIHVEGGINSYRVNGFPINGSGSIIIRNADYIVSTFQSSSAVGSITRDTYFTDIECLIIDYVPSENRRTTIKSRRNTGCP
tara:strand:+ start:9325 stop:9912 length:588 start_codon:yes stop_codon:yes gene_type:complete